MMRFWPSFLVFCGILFLSLFPLAPLLGFCGIICLAEAVIEEYEANIKERDIWMRKKLEQRWFKETA